MKFKQVRLPRQLDGRELKIHPLITGLESVMADPQKGYTLSYMARSHFKVRAQAVHAWMKQAKKKRNFNIPVRQIVKVCKLTGQPPYIYNPELYPNPEWRV